MTLDQICAKITLKHIIKTTEKIMKDLPKVRFPDISLHQTAIKPRKMDLGPEIKMPYNFFIGGKDKKVISNLANLI